VKKIAEVRQEHIQECCRVLGMFRRRLREGSMLEEDNESLATVLEWVEEYIVMSQPRANVAP
jgi:hypothetical protein